ncbi:Squalene/phytoene synthase [Mycena belliarum]|uniref:Squalene/phytoene synthase n=1 Tax=Mycena belliarum TaxID=1033014 RepID=A0AAD6U9J5_9AGAR|nr:Squalene/phytoene synthase [Mycena belliae]
MLRVARWYLSRLSKATYSTTAGAPIVPTDPAEYCRELVRKHDYESFLISKFWPASLQDSYFAIKAFSTELAMVQDNVSVATLGAVRMQFWRDAVRDIYAGRPPRHPIALALHGATQRASLPAYHLKRIVDARDEELRTVAYPTSEALVAHAEGVASSVLYLLLALRGLGASESLAHAASHLGTAQTLATLLWSLPHHASHRRLPLPLDICARHGVQQEDVFRHGGAAAGIDAAVYDTAVLANDHLLTAREVFNASGERVPAAAMPIFLAGVPVASFLGQLERANFNGFARSLVMRDWRLSWRIWSGYYRRKF